MPKLLITQNCEASQDGLTLTAFTAGKTYDVTPHAEAVLLSNGWATPAPVAADAPEVKAAPAAPENKAGTPAPEAKASGKPGKTKGR